MIIGTKSILEDRFTAGRFDPSSEIDEATIRELIRLATHAPSAFHLQNWSFIAAHSREARERLLPLAFGQRQVVDAAVTIIVCGELNSYKALEERLQASVDAGILRPSTQQAWVAMATASHEDKPEIQRDEAIRSASLTAMALLVAAREFGYDSGVLGGFDPQGVSRAFDLSADQIPVMLVTLGQAAPGNWAQKIRRPVGEVLNTF